MIILGIDPGLATIGFGVVDGSSAKQTFINCGVISTPAGMPLSLRLRQIYEDAGALMDMYKPDAISIEELFFNTNLKTGIAVAHARGVLVLAGQERGIPMYEYTPLQVKQAIAGYGRADKKQMMEMVRRLLNLKEAAKPDDASDALALALCHARTSAVLRNIKEKDVCSTI